MEKLYYWIILSLLFSCTNKNHQVASEKELLVDIRLENGINNQVDRFLLSEVAQNIEIIPLETNEKSVFRSVWNVSIGKENIFVNTFENILRFDRENGCYLNTIGKMGEGPTDIYYCKGCGLDENQKLVYTLSHPFGKNEVKSFTYDGEWKSTVKVAKTGAWMESGSVYGLGTEADRTYAYINGKHVFRRMLPIQDGSKDAPWQIGVVDVSGKYLEKIVDPSCIKQNGSADTQKTKDGELAVDVKYAISSSAPSLNQYYNHINCLFENNDTIYRYSEKMEVFKPRYILHCGKRPDFMSSHKLVKDRDFYQYINVSDVLETKEYLFLVASRNKNAYLLRVDKNTGAIRCISEEGTFRESSYWNTKFPELTVPCFTNDLCGGLPFFPFDQNKHQWIAKYEAADLLEQIDIDELKTAEVLMPEKKAQLIRILENLKEDDNPVIMIATLK